MEIVYYRQWDVYVCDAPYLSETCIPAVGSPIEQSSPEAIFPSRKVSAQSYYGVRPYCDLATEWSVSEYGLRYYINKLLAIKIKYGTQYYYAGRASY